MSLFIVKLFASILRSVNLSQTYCFYSPCLFLFSLFSTQSINLTFLTSELSWLFSSVVLHWKWVSKNDTSPLSHAVRPACLCDGNESLIFQLIAESIPGWRNELDFLQACASSLVGFVSKFWLQSFLPGSAWTRRRLASLWDWCVLCWEGSWEIAFLILPAPCKLSRFVEIH